MSSKHVGSNLVMQGVDVQLDVIPRASAPPGSQGAVSPAFASNAFTGVALFHGNGHWNLNLTHPAINAGSRVVVSASEYATQWNIDRFIGAAPVQVLNVSPHNGGVWVWLQVSWNSPLNIAITVFVEP